MKGKVLFTIMLVCILALSFISCSGEKLSNADADDNFSSINGTVSNIVETFIDERLIGTWNDAGGYRWSFKSDGTGFRGAPSSYDGRTLTRNTRYTLFFNKIIIYETWVTSGSVSSTTSRDTIVFDYFFSTDEKTLFLLQKDGGKVHWLTKIEE